MLILAGLKGQARFALDHAPQIIDYFSEIFQIDYPLPKCDLLAVHEFVSAHRDFSICSWTFEAFIPLIPPT
jgi:hypothetical protein